MLDGERLVMEPSDMKIILGAHSSDRRGSYGSIISLLNWPRSPELSTNYIIKKIFITSVCVCVMCMCVYMCMYM